MKMKIIKLLFAGFVAVLFILQLIAMVSATEKIFWYSDNEDRLEGLEWADKYKFDSLDYDDFNDFDKYACVDLEAYNNFADSDKYDKFKRWTAGNIDKDDLKKLDRTDYNTIANQNPHDDIDPDDFDDYDDMQCWDLDDYNEFASLNKYDKWDVVDFTDYDDLDIIQKVGKNRFHFFDEDDFGDFDLWDIDPSLAWRYNNYNKAQIYGTTSKSGPTYVPKVYHPYYHKVDKYPNYTEETGGKYGFGFRKPREYMALPRSG